MEKVNDISCELVDLASTLDWEYFSSIESKLNNLKGFIEGIKEFNNES